MIVPVQRFWLNVNSPSLGNRNGAHIMPRFGINSERNQDLMVMTSI